MGGSGCEKLREQAGSMRYRPFRARSSIELSNTSR